MTDSPLSSQTLSHLNVQLSLRAKLLEDYFPVISLVATMVLWAGPVESQRPSLWEMIPMPPSPLSLPSHVGGSSEHNYALARYGSSATSKFGSNDNGLPFPSNKVGNALGNQINYQAYSKRKRVLIDPAYTLGCTQEGYFPLPGTCSRFLRCRKSRKDGRFIGFRGFVFRCPLGFYYSGESGRRCLPLPVSGARQAECEGNTNFYQSPLLRRRHRGNDET